jgi:glycosyltransferase involved in cell wall biosynthesis
VVVFLGLWCDGCLATMGEVLRKTVTTVIPAFQEPILLKKAVESVLNQTYPHFILYVCDDGADEATYELMQYFLKLDSRVQYYRHPERLGLIKNYQYGFSKVETPYFSFLSHDDWLLPHFYETALRDLTDFPGAAFSVCASRIVNSSGEHLFDSLVNWSTKGLFEPPLGFFEILSPSFKPPIPTCILFNYELTREINFDWNENIQLLWDPAFLMQIAERFPFFVNDTICGFYLADDQGYSSGFYKRLQKSSKELSVYLNTAFNLIERMESSDILSREMKLKARRLLRKFFSFHTKQYIQSYFNSKKINSACHATLLLFHFLWKTFTVSPQRQQIKI